MKGRGLPKAPPPYILEGPDYPVVRLKKSVITVAAVQYNNPSGVDPENPRPGIKKNLEHVLYMMDAALRWPPGPKDLLVFPEFTMTSFESVWTRKQFLRVAISLPGEETEAIGKKARELGCYVVLGSHTQEADWPGHFMNTSYIISPEGKLIHKHWKAYGGFPGIGIEYATTVHDVLDEFTERYGWDAVWPVVRTDIGNLSSYICSEGFQQETARAFAFNGAEIICRCIAGASEELTDGVAEVKFRADCANGGVYGVFANTGHWKSGLAFNACGGSSMVVNPRGRILAQAPDSNETIVSYEVPIAEFRKTHVIPSIRKELYAPVYELYVGEYPPNMYAKYLPKDIWDANRWSMKHKQR